MSDALKMEGNVRVNTQLVTLLEAALNDARAGKLRGGAVIAVLGPSSFYQFSADGGFKGEVIAGAQVLTSDVIQSMRQQQTPRRIIPARPIG